MIFGLSIAACAPTPDGLSASPTADEDSPTVTEEAELPSEYIYDEAGDPEPLLSIGELEESIQDVLAVIQQTNPALLTVSYDALRLDVGDDYCPYYYYDESGDAYYGYDYWYGNCTADGGASFDGYAYSYSYGEYTSGSYRYLDQGYLLMYGSVTDRFGEVLEVSGSYYHDTYIYNQYLYGYARLAGDVRWSSGAVEETWLGEEYSLNLTISHSQSPSGERDLQLEGSLSGIPGVVNAALFEDVYLYSGSACMLEPSGNISIRDSEGDWYLASFQGAPYSWAPVFSPECDGCGDVFYRGERMGSICPDFSAMTDWEVRPWPN